MTRTRPQERGARAGLLALLFALVVSGCGMAAAIRPVDDPRDLLLHLTVDDGAPPDDYRRDEWPHWRDIDDDGCDARDQALLLASTQPVRLRGRCDVTGGRWVSDYDGAVLTDPGDLDVDHVVPLSNAHVSGADAWSTDLRARYANDQADLWVVSASSNRSKGDQPPNEWRPLRHEVWCEYASRWTSIKARWRLTITTPERDALGQMLDTCPPAPES